MFSQLSWPLLEGKPTRNSCGQLFTVSQSLKSLDNEVNSALEEEQSARYEKITF